MKPFIPIAFVAAVLFVAGCESSSTTSIDSGTAALPRDTGGRVSASNEVNKSSTAVWPNQQTANKDEELREDNQAKIRFEVEEEPPPEKDPPIPEDWKALNREKTLYFEKAANGIRRVHLICTVCLREGQLEVLVCKANTKEHESILSTDLDARDAHTALLAAGAKPGTTVRFVPEYKPATGDTIRVTLTYVKNGKLQTNVPAQKWIQHVRTKKDLEHDWVFAGSRLFKFPDEPQRPPYYCANNGEIISVANFSDSMLDLPVKSSKEAAELGYVANKEQIPNLKTKVIVTLEILKKG